MNPVRWFEIYVEDMDRARQFYQSMLEVELSKIEATDLDIWGFPMENDSYGSTGALVHMPGFQPGGNSVIIYFACDDCAVEEQRAVDAGGIVQKSKQSIGPYGFISLLLDSEGNMIGLHSMN